jgi:hypothetical protein
MKLSNMKEVLHIQRPKQAKEKVILFAILKRLKRVFKFRLLYQMQLLVSFRPQISLVSIKTSQYLDDEISPGLAH